MKSHYIYIIIIALFLKISYVGLAYYLHKNNTPLAQKESFGKGISINLIAEIYKRFDSGWYEIIALNGHSPISKEYLIPNDEKKIGQSYYAFFPLYPFSIRTVMQITSLNFNTVALLFSVIYSIGLFIVLYGFLSDYLKRADFAFQTTLIIMLFPFHYFFSMIYSESLFLLLLVGSYWAILRKKYVILFIVSGLLVLVRPNGIISFVPLFFFFCEQLQIKFQFLFSTKWKELINQFFSIQSLPILFLFAMPLFFLGYCTYLYFMTEEFFAFSVAQKGWKKNIVFPLCILFNRNTYIDQFNSFYTSFFIILTLINIRKTPFSFSLLNFFNILLPLTYGSILSLPRYISVIFPLFISFHQLLRPIFRFSITYILLFALHIYSYYFWLIEDYLSV